MSFGSQVSLFAELHGLRGPEHRPPTARLPTAFTGKIDRRVNVGHQFDPLAFVMGRVLKPAGEPVTDRRLRLDHIPRDLGELGTAHSSYWADPRFAAELARVPVVG